MKITFRQVHECTSNIFGRQRHRVRGRLALHKFRRHAAAGDRGRTAVCPKPGIGHKLIPYFQPYLHAFAVAGLGFRISIGVRNRLGIAWMEYMLDGRLGVDSAESLYQVFKITHLLHYIQPEKPEAIHSAAPIVIPDSKFRIPNQGLPIWNLESGSWN